MCDKKTILNIFTQISTEKEATKPDLCIRLWHHLNYIKPEIFEETEDIPQDVTYTLRRLIQGLGSPRSIIRKSYFASLVAILSNWTFTHSKVTLKHFKSLIDKHLSKYESKGEEGEVLTGRILAYGVTFRSKLFLTADVELQQEILSEILLKSKERSYLPFLTYFFIVDLIKSVDEEFFKRVIWPTLMSFILVGWSHQSFDTLYCLLEVQNHHPSLLKKKLMFSVFAATDIFNLETVEYVKKILTNISGEACLKHPVYDSVCSYLCRNFEDSELLIKFWECVENVLKSSPTKLQQVAVLKVFCSIVKHANFNQIPLILTPCFTDYLINSCRSMASKKDVTITSKETLSFLISHMTHSEENIPSVIYKILCKILFDSKYLLVDKITGIKVVTPCMAKLDAKHVQLLAKKCENIVLLKPTEKENLAQHRWNFKERCYAAQFLARLISHPESQDMDWKIKHLKLIMKYALFASQVEDCAQMSNELAGVLKNSFFTALSHQLSHLENHRMVLISLVFYIDNILSTEPFQLRNPLSDEMLLCWKNTMQKIQKIDLKINKTSKQKTVIYVFHTLFLQMALHLFVDPTLAKDILNELDRCYKKQKSQFKMMKVKEEESTSHSHVEPKWIEIAVELFLSLLSRDAYLLRQLISRIFPHLCPFLTAQASFQILQIFDPNSNDNILTDGNESEDSSDEDDHERENENSLKPHVIQDVDDESDSDVEELDDVEESAIEKTRQAVRDALGVAGSVTDTESIDLDDIDEEEGRKLDLALSEAFRIAKKPQNIGESKKQSPSEKALMNFRIRVLDLVDIYLDNDPSLSLVLDTIPALFALLEFCIKDKHQKPLETRLRSTLKKIGHLKKCTNVEKVNENILADVLKTLMEKGVRTTSVFLNLCHEMSGCCTFLLKMGIQICRYEDISKSSELFNTFAAYVDNFFMKRDCLLPISLFENILMKTNWVNNVELCRRILSYSLSSSVRGFRRNQGLHLLSCFYKNTRLSTTFKENDFDNCMKLEDEILENAYQVLIQLKSRNDEKLKPSFVSELFVLLHSMKMNRFLCNSQKWNKIVTVLEAFCGNGFLIPSVSRKYMIKLCSLLQVHPLNKQSVSRKRKRIRDEEKQDVLCNGITVHEMHYGNGDDKIPCIDVQNESENVSNCKTVIKKKKSKRKTEEHFNSKRLRSNLANDVEVLKFSSSNILET